MPGMTIETWFTPTEPGDFEIACAEHCGLGHYRMRGAGARGARRRARQDRRRAAAE